jgi:hypothetical protein
MENQTDKLSSEETPLDTRSSEDVPPEENLEDPKSGDEPKVSEEPQGIMEPKGERILNILVSYPSEVESLFGSTMIYKVVVERESGKEELFRRYSEFYELRKTLIARFPCVFVLPVHKRQFIGNKSRSFLLQRVYELNTFTKYILQREFLARCDLVEAFFSKQDFKEVAGIFKKSRKPTPEELLSSYKLIFTNIANKVDSSEAADVKHSKIEKFKQKVETNIEFFYRLKNCVESFSSKRQELKVQEEENQIYEMILITYSNQAEQYEQLKKSFGDMTAYESDSQWSLFAHKIEMLIRELEFFYEMVNQIRGYENQFVANEERKKKYKEKLNELGSEESETVGFFKRQNRREVIQKYQDLLFETEQKSVFWKELLQMIYNVVIHSELDIFKERKKNRYSEILKDFGEKKRQNLGDYFQFWTTIIKPQEN